ncbi:ferritin-like domain-containing protein [Micromonospora sp. FIMYZ51]|uniref:ferritin-like domain-containing protein n=1 Tax=Micromonospora sp. FIMYZ51 TaxID=3051832 RepID=UPI0031200053
MPTLWTGAPVEVHISPTYDIRDGRVAALYESAKLRQWNASTDVDWTVPVPYGSALPDDSRFAMASFGASPLARRGRGMWDTFRWELQTWLVSQFLHGEQAALVVAARLIETVPDIESKTYAASQAADEARHVEVFSRYLREYAPEIYPVTASLRELLDDILTDSRWDVTALGMQLIVEALAMAAFRLADGTFHDDLIKQITRLVARDEARHVTFGVLTLDGIYADMTSAERADREDMVLEAATLMRRRFLIEDIWERLEVPRDEGVRYASTDPLMVTYRQALFAKVISALRQVGLFTPRVRAGLDGLGLLAFGPHRINGSGHR